MISKKESPFTIKDIQKLKSLLQKSGAKPIKKGDKITLSQKDFNILMKLDRRANKILNAHNIIIIAKFILKPLH